MARWPGLLALQQRACAHPAFQPFAVEASSAAAGQSGTHAGGGHVAAEARARLAPGSHRTHAASLTRAVRCSVLQRYSSEHPPWRCARRGPHVAGTPARPGGRAAVRAAACLAGDMRRTARRSSARDARQGCVRQPRLQERKAQVRPATDAHARAAAAACAPGRSQIWAQREANRQLLSAAAHRCGSRAHVPAAPRRAGSCWHHTSSPRCWRRWCSAPPRRCPQLRRRRAASCKSRAGARRCRTQT